MLTERRLAVAGSCVGGRVLAMVFEKYSKDFKTWTHGMPDLILWKEAEGTCKFVEVKSENDSLSEQQKCWIANLTQAGARVDLCHVRDGTGGVDAF